MDFILMNTEKANPFNIALGNDFFSDFISNEIINSDLFENPL